MSLFLVLLAAGDGKRLKTKVPKPYYKVKHASLLEHALNAFKSFPQIKKTLIVFNKKHSSIIFLFLIKVNCEHLKNPDVPTDHY
mgnify:CR=1 FL=1